MTAYNTTDLNNKLVNENADEAFYYGLIDAGTCTTITTTHPVRLYTPNYFIRIGLGFLATTACLFSGLLFWMLFGISNVDAIESFLFFLSAACYITLELFVTSKKYYNAGIDNILLFAVVSFLFGGCTLQDVNSNYIMSTGLCFIACLWMSYRFVDAFAGVLAYVFFFLFIYFDFTHFFAASQTAAPLLMMAVSAAAYFLVKKISIQQKWMPYTYCADCIILLTLATFYISGNYYIVREGTGNLFFGIRGEETNTAPLFSWLFWIFTICTPVAYLAYGINARSLLFIRTGILALAATILTIRYYHTVIPADVALMLAGAILIVISYLLIKYLRTQKRGYAFDAPTYNDKNTPDAEALIIAQAFGHKHSVPERGVEFGGGSSGGGGATGSF